MSLFTKFKDFLWRLLKKLPKNTDVQTTVKEPMNLSEIYTAQETLEQFKTRNLVFEKLKHLEQYIKLFSLTFPDKYAYYLSLLQKHRQEYEFELQQYNDGLLGELTFAIDPECESNRLVTIATLENEIYDFVEFEVNYSIYKDKFSKLCHRLVRFYNVLLDTNKDTNAIISQLKVASSSVSNFIFHVSKMRFFNEDSRKKEEILDYVIYAEYIIFKSYFRCSTVKDLEYYKQNLSSCAKMFVSSQYDYLMSNFFIEDLEKYQTFITTNLKQDQRTYNYVLKSCQALQNSLNFYEREFSNYAFFLRLIQLENTVDDISENYGMEYIITISSLLESQLSLDELASVKDVAISVLELIKRNKAKILCKIISEFKNDISWREFFFLCKIFELYKDVVEVSHNTIFCSVGIRFEKLECKYSQYSDSFIQAEKKKLLSYQGHKKKRYVLLLEVEDKYLTSIANELKNLQLDFLVLGNNVYINHSYFNGFKNLEQNFGQYKLLEELL